jgi:myo-inositol-1-phosphate synthase
MARVLANYDISSIEIVAAFDIDRRKVGLPLRDAIFSAPNVARIFERDIIGHETVVQPGPIFDGMPDHMWYLPPHQRFWPPDDPYDVTATDVVAHLRKTTPDFLICYLPVGSVAAVHFYAECALEAGVSFINAMPVFIASSPDWVARFAERGLVVLGDDVKSQIGATILHRAIVALFRERGGDLRSTYQINIGGNTDFLNMTDKGRLKLKLQSKVESVRSQYSNTFDHIYAGPADYIEHLEDRKTAYIHVEGVVFGGLPIEVDLKVTVEDSPNSAGVMIDVVRLAKAEINRSRIGALEEISAYGFKRPLRQMSDGYIFEWIRRWRSEKEDVL